MKKYVAYTVLFAIVLTISLIGYRERYKDTYEIQDFGSIQKEALKRREHFFSDEMIRNAVKIRFKYNCPEDANKQIDILFAEDSDYWPVMYCKALLSDEKRHGLLNRIKYYEKARELMGNASARFNAGGGIYFTECYLLDRLTDLCLAKYNWCHSPLLPYLLFLSFL